MRTSDNDDITLLDARVRTTTFGGEVSKVGASTLILGAHVERSDPWPKAVYSTANLSEWRADTGIRVSRPEGGPSRLRLDWHMPTTDKVRLVEAQLTFSGEMSSSGVTYAPDWSINTWQTMVVDPDQPMTIDELYRGFAGPLLAFTIFVSDRPDSLTREVLMDPENDRHVFVWRQGQQISPRTWRPGDGDGYLFGADQLADYDDAVRRWWRLNDEIWPVLGIYAQHVNEGTTYSPARLISLYSALEAYSRVRFGKKDFKQLRTYAGVPNDVTGCTNAALNLLGYCRGYFAHLNPASPTYSPSDADAGTFDSTRRASALMQACLLRELGFDAPAAESILRTYYARWPIQ